MPGLETLARWGTVFLLALAAGWAFVQAQRAAAKAKVERDQALQQLEDHREFEDAEEGWNAEGGLLAPRSHDND